MYLYPPRPASRTTRPYERALRDSHGKAELDAIYETPWGTHIIDWVSSIRENCGFGCLYQSLSPLFLRGWGMILETDYHVSSTILQKLPHLIEKRTSMLRRHGKCWKVGGFVKAKLHSSTKVRALLAIQISSVFICGFAHGRGMRRLLALKLLLDSKRRTAWRVPVNIAGGVKISICGLRITGQ